MTVEKALFIGVDPINTVSKYFLADSQVDEGWGPGGVQRTAKERVDCWVPNHLDDVDHVATEDKRKDMASGDLSQCIKLHLRGQ